MAAHASQPISDEMRVDMNEDFCGSIWQWQAALPVGDVCGGGSGRSLGAGLGALN